jgi:hypothetical protein
MPSIQSMEKKLFDHRGDTICPSNPIITAQLGWFSPLPMDPVPDPDALETTMPARPSSNEKPEFAKSLRNSCCFGQAWASFRAFCNCVRHFLISLSLETGLSNFVPICKHFSLGGGSTQPIYGKRNLSSFRMSECSAMARR